MNKFIGLLITVITGKLVGFLTSWLSRLARRKEIKRKNAEIRDRLKNADTKEEREKAARILIDNS
jgi:hypothetical protein